MPKEHSESPPLPEGKLPIDVLTGILGSISKGNLVVSPNVGVDVGVTKTRGKFMVSSSDPITGTQRRMGWHAVNVSANDVATSGIMPTNLSVVAMFPPSTRPSEIVQLMSEVNGTAGGLGITVAGGHTEITPGLKKPIVVVTAFGTGDRFVTASMAKKGDSILMTKTVGIEGTSILASLQGATRLLPRSILQKGQNLISSLSILKEARLAFKTGLVHAMHDVTEGGVLGAVLEMSLASRLGFELDADSIPIDESTRLLCARMSLDPLRLLGSGSLLICCSKKDERRIMRHLVKSNVPCAKIGTLLAKTKEFVVVSGKRRKKVKQVSIQDELWQALHRFGKSG